MKAIFKERLLKLANFLETVPAHKFDYSSWVNGWQGDAVMSATCGTTACAFGWATAIPEFSALGLHLFKDRFGVPGVSIDKKADDFQSSWAATYDAAEELFGLDSSEAEWLFTPSDHERDSDYDSDSDTYGSDGRPYRDVEPSVVAEHIRNFVEDQDIED